jgi:hypothetical protein
MSAFGGKADINARLAMSALPPITDIPRRNINVRFGPGETHAPQQMVRLFDHLVGAGEQK